MIARVTSDPAVFKDIAFPSCNAIRYSTPPC